MNVVVLISSKIELIFIDFGTIIMSTESIPSIKIQKFLHLNGSLSRTINSSWRDMCDKMHSHTVVKNLIRNSNIFLACVFV